MITNLFRLPKINEMVKRNDTLNAATYLSRISKSDIDTHFISSLSDDQISEKMKKIWKNDGVLTDLVMTDPLHSTGLYMIEVDEKG